MAEALTADKVGAGSGNEIPSAVLVNEDGKEYTITPEAIKFSESLTVAMAHDVVMDVESQKKRLLLRIAQLMEEGKEKDLEHQDVYYYLNRKLDDNFDTISSLEEQILTEQDEREVEENKLERRIEELESKLSAEENKASVKIRDLESKIDLLKEFSDNRDKYLEKYDALEKEFQQFKETSKKELEEQEMKSIKERKENKVNTETEIEAARQEFSRRLDSSIDEKTREILLENLRIKDDMKKQEKESHAVLGLNSNIIEQDRQLRNEFELSQSAETELSNKLGLYQHLIKQLNERNTQLEKEIEELNMKNDELVGMAEDADRRPMEGSVNIDDTYLDFLNVLSSHYNTKIGHERKIDKVSRKEVDAVICAAFEVISRKFPNRFLDLLKKRGETLKLPKIPATKPNSLSPSKASSTKLVIASSNVTYSPQKWWEGDARGLSAETPSSSYNNNNNNNSSSSKKKTKSIAVQTDKDESVVEISDLKKFIILGDEVRKDIKTNPLKPQELDIITGGAGIDDSVSVPTQITDLSDDFNSSENSSRNAKISIKSENAKYGRKYVRYSKPSPMIGGGTLVLDPNYVDTPPTFLSGSDSASRLKTVQLGLNAVGKSVQGSVDMSRGSLSLSPQKKKTLGGSVLRRTPVERIPGSPPLGASRGAGDDTLIVEYNDVNDSDVEDGIVSPSSAVSMSPRLEALQ